jgi:hypothetical protein
MRLARTAIGRSRIGGSVVRTRFCRGYAHIGSRAGLHPLETLYASQPPPQLPCGRGMGSNRRQPAMQQARWKAESMAGNAMESALQVSSSMEIS